MLSRILFKIIRKNTVPQNLLISIPQVMVYFEDAEEDEDPVSLKGQSWSQIKKTISKKVSAHLR